MVILLNLVKFRGAKSMENQFPADCYQLFKFPGNLGTFLLMFVLYVFK